MTGKPTTLSIVIEATVSKSDWYLTYGSEVHQDLPEYVANATRFLTCLTSLLPDGGSMDGADVTLAASEPLTDRTSPCFAPDAALDDDDRQGVRVMLNVTLDTAQWRRFYGGDPVTQVGAAIIAGLGEGRPSREEWSGVYAFRPDRSGVLLAEDTYRTRPVAPAEPRRD